MLRQVKLDVRDGVAIISLAPPPGAGSAFADHGFDPALRQQLAQVLAEAGGSGAVEAVLLCAGAAGWPVAADPESARAGATEAPTLAELAAMIEAMAKPVVVALGGRLGSAALALALAAGWRLAAPGLALAPAEPAQASLPEAGLLVRAARRAGAVAALRLALPGGAVAAPEAAELGLIDGIVENGYVDAAALAVARGLAAPAQGATRPPQRADGAGLADPATFLAALAAARGALPRLPANLRAARAAAISVVEAALLLPYDEALAFAEVARADLEAAPVCRALSHVAAAEARARGRALAGVAVADPAAGARIGLWGVGTGLAPLAEALAAVGFGVVIGADDEAAMADTLAAVARRQQAAEAAGRLAPAARAAAWARIEGAASAADLAGCAWVLSGADVAAALPPGVGLVLDGAASPAFPGAPALRLVAPGLAELVVAPGDAAAELAWRVAATLIAAHLVVLRAGPGPLGLTARLAARAFAAAERAVLAGARPDQVDAALGLADPPFRRADRLGLARVVSDLRALGWAPGPLSLRLLAERLVDRPSTFYRGEGAPADRAVADVVALLPALRAEAGLDAVPLDTAAIRARVLAELADEGVAMLQSGQATAADDIDLAAVHGLGLPKSLGGPMHAADAAGILATRNLLRGLSGPGATPPGALWDVLIRNGRHFADLDRSAG